MLEGCVTGAVRTENTRTAVEEAGLEVEDGVWGSEEVAAAAAVAAGVGAGEGSAPVAVAVPVVMGSQHPPPPEHSGALTTAGSPPCAVLPTASFSSAPAPTTAYDFGTSPQDATAAPLTGR